MNDMKKKKILYIEDETDQRDIVKTIIEANGFEVIEAQDGEMGLKMAFREKPDLIMLDVMMPKVDGIEFLRKLRAEEWGKEMPVIMETQVSDIEKMSEGVQLGVQGYILKSDYSLDAILRQVEHTFK